MGLFGKRVPEKRVPEWLERYPPYQAPFAGPASKLSLADAEANLAYLLANRDARLGILEKTLGSRVDLANGLSTADPQPFLNSLHEWTRDVFPKIFDASLATRAQWLASDRKGPQIVYSLLMDLAIALGECVTRRRSAYRWSLDLDPDNEADEMYSVKRPVVQIPKGGPFRAPVIFDPESQMVSVYFSVPKPLFGRFNDVGHAVLEYTSGAHERPAQFAARGGTP